MRCIRLVVLLGGLIVSVHSANAAGGHRATSPYFPLARGNAWVYTLYSNIQDSILRLDTIRVDDVAHRKGKSYYHISTPWFPIFSVWCRADSAGDIYWCNDPKEPEHPLLLFSAEPGEGWLMGGKFCVDSTVRIPCLAGSDQFCFKGVWRPGDCYDAKWLGQVEPGIGPVTWIMAGAGEASLEWNLVEFLQAPQCECKCHADPICDGEFNALDLAIAIDVAFRGMPPPTDHGCWCYAHAMNGRTDVDCSGGTDALDISRIIDVLFAGADPAKEFCDPTRW